MADYIMDWVADPAAASSGENAILSLALSQSGIMAADNGASPAVQFGLVRYLTPMGRLSSGLWRPAGTPTATASGSGVNVVTVDYVAGLLFEGDVVTLREADGTPRASARTVTGIAALVVTLSGATFSPAIGDYLTLDAVANGPQRLLVASARTQEQLLPSGAVLNAQQPVQLMVEGAVNASMVLGNNAALRAALTGPYSKITFVTTP